MKYGNKHDHREHCKKKDIQGQYELDQHTLILVLIMTRRRITGSKNVQKTTI